jgi:predicted DNA-binding transcriptional regulator YafY
MSRLSTERIARIVRIIRTRGAVSKATLVEELEVSPASIKRDLHFLRDRLGCPWEYDRTRRGYVIRDDLAKGGRFELPGLWFDSSELFALLTMLHLVEGVQPGLLTEHVGPLKARLRDMLAQGGKSSTSIERKVKLVHFASRKVEPAHFKVVAGALLDGKRLRLTYWNRDKKERTERAISPQKLVHYRENWLLDAWCHERNGLRSFALESIEGVEVLDDSAIEVSQDQLDEHFRSGYGIFAGAATHRARLRFTPERAQYVAKETWHRNQASSWEPDGSYILEVPYSNDQELIMDLLRHGPEVEVLEPPSLRQNLHATLCAAARRYGAPVGAHEVTI